MVIENHQEVVYVSGLLRSNQWPVIKTSAWLVYESYPQGIVIDFSGVRWLSAEGETTLIAALTDIETNRLPFLLVNLPETADDALSASAFHRMAERSESQRIAQAIFSEAWWKRLWGSPLPQEK